MSLGVLFYIMFINKLLGYHCEVIISAFIPVLRNSLHVSGNVNDSDLREKMSELQERSKNFI